ncbi:MAG TPA: EAL domain-containing protein [Acidiferrobacteraceae bacterium]|nr:EAL domain-containing protein [Acidiferrobacteraceae bacterium]
MGWTRKLGLFNRSLTGRLMLGLLLIHLVLIPLLFGGMYFIVRQGYETHFVNHVRSDAHQFSSMATYVLRTGGLEKLIEESLLTGRLILAEVRNQNKREIIITAGQDGLPPFKEDFFFGQHGDGIYYITLPLPSGEGVDPNLIVRLGYDEAATHEQIDLAYLRGIYVTLSYLLSVFALVFFLGRKLTEPLLRLRTVSRSIAAGHFNEQLNVDTKFTEVKNLAEDLDYMRKNLVEQALNLEYQALHDALTGLPNRALLHDRLERAILNSQRSNAPCAALLLMDLDGFKDINDTLGHQAGDLVLQQVASRLLEMVRESDTVARLGGDEFALVLPLTSTEPIQPIVEKMLRGLQQPYVVEGQPLVVGTSLGVALLPEHGRDGEDLLRKADVAMYVAKRSGGGYTVYEPGQDRHSLTHFTLAGELRQAIEGNQLTVYYQPKLDLKGDTRAAEALVRWQHPEKGLIPPDDFIATAEKTGLIESLTVAVLDEAISHCFKWCQTGQTMKIAVNLSPRNLQDPQLPETIANILSTHDMEPSFLQLELTESAIFSDPSRALRVLNRIDEMGVQISIDDFGTGYSSLAQLRDLPVSEIKIDRSFVMDMRTNKKHAAIVRTTIDLARNLGLTVVAEGVEDAKTLDILRRLGCDMAQGYYISPPIPAADFEVWLKGQQRYTANG